MFYHSLQRLHKWLCSWLPVRWDIIDPVRMEIDVHEADDSSYVNGQNFAVDGGLSASHPVVPGRWA